MRCSTISVKTAESPMPWALCTICPEYIQHDGVPHGNMHRIKLGCLKTFDNTASHGKSSQATRPFESLRRSQTGPRHFTQRMKLSNYDIPAWNSFKGRITKNLPFSINFKRQHCTLCDSTGSIRRANKLCLCNSRGIR